MAICPELATFVMLAMIALGLPVLVSCATALFKLLTSEQYAGALAAAVVLLAAAVVLLEAVVLLALPHPARNAVAVRARTTIAVR
jgi:hypothetical protein